MDTDTVLALDASAQGIALMKSTIPRPDAGLGFFAYKTVGKGKVVCYCYGFLVY